MPTPFSVDPVKSNGGDADAMDALIAREGFFTSIDQTSSDSEGELERRLREVEDRYRGLVDRLPAVIYIDGVGEGDRMVDVSPAVADLLGVSREEWLETYLVLVRFIQSRDRVRVQGVCTVS